MIFFIITTCLYNDSPLRKQQYTNGIGKLKQVIQDKQIENYKIILVENNGLRPTYLDDFGCDVYYTNNNELPTQNKGYKELQDVFDCIKQYHIDDHDFIVKITGRYVLEDNSYFMDVIKNIPINQFQCVLRYGPFFAPVNYKMHDCISGLIGMRCDHVKRVEYPVQNECVEWKWAKATDLIEDDKIHKVDKLGIHICPGGNRYFLV
jgi:hypothetical protein